MPALSRAQKYDGCGTFDVARYKCMCVPLGDNDATMPSVLDNDAKVMRMLVNFGDRLFVEALVAAGSKL